MKLGRYQLVSKLATGGMAEVYLARVEGPRGFEKELVVKRILPHLAAEPQFVEMFLAEAQLAAKLDHPHLVQIFDFGETDGTFYLAMEYIDGLNLRVLARHAKAAEVELPPAACARIIANACEGLAYAHERTHPATGEPLQLIHRDISPDNILLSRQGAVKVVDFGIAKAAGHGQRTQTGVVKGKLSYLPPELFRGLAPDRRVDVYALGIVLYELLTGRRPFEATTDADLARVILYETPRPAAEYRPGLAPALQRILDKALAKDREQRYWDCRALQSDLEHFILSTGEPFGAWQLARLLERVTESRAEAPTERVEAFAPRSPTPRPRPATPAPKPRPERVPTPAAAEVTRLARTPTPKPAPVPAPAEPTVRKERPVRPPATPSPRREATPRPSAAPTRRMERVPDAPAPVPPELAQRRMKLLVAAGAGAAVLFALMVRVLLVGGERPVDVTRPTPLAPRSTGLGGTRTPGSTPGAPR